VVAHTLFIKSLEFAASVSARWRTVVNFLVLQKQAGKNLKNDYEIGPDQMVQETGSRKAQGQV